MVKSPKQERAYVCALLPPGEQNPHLVPETGDPGYLLTESQDAHTFPACRQDPYSHNAYSQH